MTRLVHICCLSLGGMVVAGAWLSISAQEQAPLYDVVIRGGTVIDGTGVPPIRADVAIRGDRIARVAPSGIPARDGRMTLDATGMIVAPGFIDQHAHVQMIADYPLAETLIRQGITSVVSSPHSGDQPYPLASYMAALKVAPNVAFFAGHSWTRRRVMGSENRAPTAAEMTEMKRLIEESLAAGAMGLSTGVAAVPGRYAKAEEIVELAKIAASYGGIYVTHIRDESAGVLEAVAEAIHVGEAAGLPVQISHMTIGGAAQWGWSTKVLALIEQARAKGLDVTFDVYPYTSFLVASSALLPRWATEDEPSSSAKRLREPATRKKLEADMRQDLLHERIGGDLTRLQFRKVPSQPRYAGRSLAEVAAERGLPKTIETAVRLILDLESQGGFTAIEEPLDDMDLQRFLQYPNSLICTEDNPVGLGEDPAHPRSYGTTARLLGHYVRDRKVLTLEDAIRRLTSASAAQIGQKERGRLAEGSYADITVFDAATIADRATVDDPHHFPVGIRHVIVNGVPVIRTGALTGERPGRVLKGPARQRGATPANRVF